ncbi:MAG: hypothetical protein A3J63_02430 [Candidatus Moranbacteria bacterium RIFCSPHIGHO2_02_FULL_40_12b]|nr:MAG: hypothetical protein A3J63_02430 [Candidatus Moranbacteria bacterium RIFCSPHIGHO2_02_FULL_40_12b]OGI23766.1 MAG: hypothetical protein A3E91_02960 [Candidatus Moranbacteria bacterium RIFCSPHIGHO2_12_FULL_40_10]
MPQGKASGEICRKPDEVTRLTAHYKPPQHKAKDGQQAVGRFHSRSILNQNFPNRLFYLKKRIRQLAD